MAYADDFDLEKVEAKTDTKSEEKRTSAAPPAASTGWMASGPITTVKPHAFTLAECLALMERNYPLLWAARARLAEVHAQLDEARYTPYSNWSATAATGLLPNLGGSVFYNAVPRSLLSKGFAQDFQPFLQFGVSGKIPLYTFGKIDSILRAAEAQIRVNEWDLEKNRVQARADLRRAYYGLMLARDGLYVAEDILRQLDGAIEKVTKKLAVNDASVEEPDRLRLEIYRDELLARVGDARKGETFAVAALRFLTGVQTAFDIPDDPLKRPETSLGPVVRYLTAARLFRADVNMARAGVAGRRALVDFARAQLYPNIGLGLGFSYAIAPSATPQSTAWLGDPFNGSGPSIGLGLDWGLDLLPKNARVNAAEAKLEEARAMERHALGGVAVEVENAHGVAVEANAREQIWDRSEHRAKRWISSVQDAIDLGTKDERALVEPLRVYVFARANHIQALMDVNLALSELARITGWEAAAPRP